MADNYDIAIVGSGLAGTVTLVHELLRIADDPRVTVEVPVNIAILERYPEQLHGGIAYGKMAEFEEHRLNLTSKQALVFPADKIPEGFPVFPDYILDLANAAEQEEKAKILNYLQNPPRELFGQYLSHLVDLAKERAGEKAKVTTRIAEVTDLEVNSGSKTIRVSEEGEMRTITASKVVLGPGCQETLRPSFVEKIVDSPLYLDDNYSGQAPSFYEGILARQAQQREDEQQKGSTLIIGTGLSAMDSAIRLIKSGYKGEITMISRNGLEHAGYGAVSTEEYLAHSLIGEPRPERRAQLERKPPRFMAIVEAAKQKGEGYSGSVEADLVQSMTREFALHMKHGYTSEEVLGYWERFIPDIGDVLSHEACDRLHAQYATWMTTHRVGTTPENARIIAEAQNSGQLKITAGYISTREDERLRETDGKIQATIIPQERVGRAEAISSGKKLRSWVEDFDRSAQDQVSVLTFDQVISGLGYSLDYSNPRDPFLKSMVEKGLAVPHKKATTGFELDGDSTLIDANGRRVEGVTVVGTAAVGAAMFGRSPHPEKPGVTGGRMPPYYANIPGITGMVIPMGDGLHESLMQERAREAEIVKGREATGLSGNALLAASKAAEALRGAGGNAPQAAEPSPAATGSRQEWERAATAMQRAGKLGLGGDLASNRTDDAMPDLVTAASTPRTASPEQGQPAPVRRG